MNRLPLRRIAAVGALALALAAAPAAADNPNDDPSRALPFAGAASGTISGVSTMLGYGRFSFYTFQYPGDGSPLTVQAEITPGDPVSASRAGVQIYGPSGGKLYAATSQTSTHPSHFAQFSSTEAGTYVLQVFNYNVTPIHYDVTVSGLPPQPSPTPIQTPVEGPGAPAAPTATPVPVGENTSVERAATLDGAAEGTLGGSQGGSFEFFRIDYPGKNAPVQLTLTVDPRDASTQIATGAIVYGPTAGREYLRVGYQNVPSPGVGTFRATEAGTYVIQVGSYTGRPIHYRLEVGPGV